ncbi:hypothetical protein F5I97DRAFT_959271 [Phlebopus sp. FC_14]|nr:hypothetical protein F5I97DRAFT_959271 [Phlebopus sp. FC_14]
MQWASSTVARSIVKQTWCHRPLVLSFCPAASLRSRASLNLPSRSISSTSRIPSPQPSLKPRPSLHPEDGFHNGTTKQVPHPQTTQPSSVILLSQLSEKSQLLPWSQPPDLSLPSEKSCFPYPPFPPVESSLPASRLAIVAAESVRHLCSVGAVGEAHYVVKSLQYSAFPDIKKVEIHKLPLLPSWDFVPIKFDKTISPTLAAHTLLHHYIRNESPLQAYTVADKLISGGMKIRPKTLDIIAERLLNAPPTILSALKDRSKTMFRRTYRLRGDIVIEEDAVKDDRIRFALALFAKAQENNVRASDRSLQRIIFFALLHGEIIFGSMFFVLLIKSYENHLQAAQQANAQMVDQGACQGTASPELRSRWQELVAESLRPPPKRIMSSILQMCEQEIMREPQSQESEARRTETLQALANLASLIQNRSLPYSDISSLLRVLYSCPKLPHEVVIVEKDKQRRLNAHRYFHQVILRLIKHLPTKNAKDPPDKLGTSPLHAMPPLSRETYNSLIHYALRHRLSVRLAEEIVHHMQQVRLPNLQPDVATYNIFIRSGTLLRRNDIACSALQELRKLKQNRNHGIMVTSSPDSKSTSRHGSKEKLTSDDVSRLLTLRRTSTPIAADAFTLTSYILHLTSTGQPHIVARVLFHVLPELSIIDHPSWGNVPHGQRAALMRRTCQQHLNRAATLGPHFFTAVLNALVKSGNTGLAERVWLLAKQAERASWSTRRGSRNDTGKEGWCLPVHAYTIMLQLYGSEARKGLLIRKGQGRAPNPQGDDRWFPHPHSKQRVTGWASYVLARSETERRYRTKRSLQLRMGTALYRSMFRAARNVYDCLTRLGSPTNLQKYHLQPDARFFKAALDLYGRQSCTIKRASRTSPSYWRQKERAARMQYSRHGLIKTKWNPFLKRIVVEMTSAGYALPKAFRRMFVGSWYYGSIREHSRPLLNHQPLGFPLPRQKFLPHSLETIKTRGLPVRRSQWKEIGRRWKHRRRRRKPRRTP